MDYSEMIENMKKDLPTGRNSGQAKGRDENMLKILELLFKALDSYSRCLKKRVLKASAEEMGVKVRSIYRYLEKLKECGCVEIMDDDIWITDFGMRCGIPLLKEKVWSRKKWSRHQKNSEGKREPAPQFETVIVPVNLIQPSQQQQQIRHCPNCNTPISSDRNACPLCRRQVPFALTTG